MYLYIQLTVDLLAWMNQLASSVLVMGGTDVALQGDNVIFTCSSGLVLNGPNISICMRNGEWEPDPRKVACKRKNRTAFIS